MTELQIVAAPTAASPPNSFRLAFSVICTRLSVDCMIKGAKPSASTLPITPQLGRICCRRMRRVLLSLNRKRTTQQADRHWERMVASAAPCTCILKTKIKIGSRIMLQAAPISTVSMPILANPCALIKAFMPSVSCTKSVPMT